MGRIPSCFDFLPMTWCGFRVVQYRYWRGWYKGRLVGCCVFFVVCSGDVFGILLISGKLGRCVLCFFLTRHTQFSATSEDRNERRFNQIRRRIMVTKVNQPFNYKRSQRIHVNVWLTQHTTPRQCHIPYHTLIFCSGIIT